MSASTVPAGVPLLKRGRHLRAEQGSCLMEYVSVLAGEPFSDRPRCTPPVLAWLAQRVNDAVSGAARRELTLRAPLLARDAPWADVTSVVLDVLGRHGHALAPDEPWFRRAARRAEAGVSWRRPDVRLCLLEAFLAFDQTLAQRPDDERDRHLIGVLDAVLDALHPAGRPVPAPRRAQLR